MKDLERLVLSHIHEEVVYVVDVLDARVSGGRVRFISDRVEAVLGYAPSEFLENPDLWLGLLHPADVAGLEESTREILRSGQPGTRRYRLRHKATGKYHWMEDRVVPLLDASGTVSGIFGVACDITQHERAEGWLEFLESSVAHAHDVVMIAEAKPLDEPGGVIVYVNQAFTRMTGYRPEEVIGHSPRFLQGELTDRGDLERVRRALAEQKPVRAELINYRKDGSTFWVEVEIVPLWNRAGQVSHWLSVQRDVSERKRAQAALRRSREELRSLTARLHSVREEEQRRIARELHDELGQALTGIKMDLSWLAQRLGLGDREVAGRVRELITLADSMIGEVRRIAADLRPSVLDDLGFAAAVEWEAEQFAGRTGLAYTLNSDAPELALSDAQSIALFRILQEALTNVARHAEARRVNIGLATKDGNVVLEVVDDGKGIGDTDVAEPTMLGLAGMRERALACGGEMTIRGSPGAGTTVTVRIPLKHPVERGGAA